MLLFLRENSLKFEILSKKQSFRAELGVKEAISNKDCGEMFKVPYKNLVNCSLSELSYRVAHEIES